MHAPDVQVTLSTGETVPLSSLYQSERMALIFLRHLGCVFCKEHVAQLRSLTDLNIVFVTLGTVEQSEVFRKKMHSPHKFICDPDKTLHGLFNIGKGGMAEFINPHTIVRTIAAMMQGYLNGLPQGDGAQMPGVFVIETDGTVTWEQRARDIADTPRAGEIKAKLRPAQQES
jgi:peroxiredoxin